MGLNIHIVLRTNSYFLVRHVGVYRLSNLHNQEKISSVVPIYRFIDVTNNLQENTHVELFE